MIMKIRKGFYYDKFFLLNIKKQKFNNFFDIVLFLQKNQNKKTGSWISRSSPFYALIETNLEIASVLNDFGLKPLHELKFLDIFKDWKYCKKLFKKWLSENDSESRTNFNRIGTKLIRFYKLCPGIFSKKWYNSYMMFLLGLQNPKTGYWGMNKGNDLSITYHIVARFFKKDGTGLRDIRFVPKNIDKIIETTWKIKNDEYPYGWLENRKWSAHHMMDVISIFNMFSKYISTNEKRKAKILKNDIKKWGKNEIEKILGTKFNISDISWYAQMPIEWPLKTRKRIYKIIIRNQINDPISYLRIVKGLGLEEFEK